MDETEANEGSTCRTNILKDRPTNTDELGTHSAVATAILDLIRGSEGGRTIALEGSWGSGKSTIVSIITSHLSSDPNRRAFVFDAWAHEGDPLRRVFLERLLSLCTASPPWLDRLDYWQRKRALLSKRSRKIKTSTEPHLSILGRIVAVSALLVPIGTALFNQSLQDGLTLDPGAWNWYAITGIAGVFLPVMVWLVGAATLHLRGSRVEADAFGLLISQSVKHETSEVSEDVDPSSVEFEQTFDEILDEALKDGGRSLVVIVDNLDRVDPLEAGRIWATLQPYFQPRPNKKWHKQLWILIPYDPKGLDRIWSRTGDVTEDRTEGLTASFIEKTMQVRFSVPRPVLSNWKSFLEAQLQLAMPDHSAGQRALVSRIYEIELTRRRGHLPPTPRELKVFANQVAALHLQWCSSRYELGQLACYVLAKQGAQSDADLLRELREGHLPSPAVAVLLPEDTVDVLASLFFGVAAPTARSILLEQPMRDALEDGDAKALSTLVSSTPGGWDVLTHVIHEHSLRSDPSGRLLSIFPALDGVLSDAPATARAHMQNSLRTLVSRTEFEGELPSQMEDWLVAALGVLDADPSKVEMYQKVISPLVSNPSEETGRRWGAMAQRLHALGFTWIDGYPLNIPEGLAGYSAFVSGALGDVGDSALRTLMRPHDLAIVDKNLIKNVDSDSITAAEVEAIENLVTIGAELDWEGLSSDSVIQMRRVGHELTLHKLFLRSARLSTIAAGADPTVYEAYVNEGFAANYLALASDAGDWQAIGEILYVWSLVDPAFSVHATVGQAARGYALLKQYDKTPPEELSPLVIAHATEGSFTEQWLDGLASQPDSRFRRSLITRILKSETLSPLISLTTIIEHWEVVRRHAWGNLIARQYCGAHDAESILKSVGFQPRLASLYSAFAQECPEIWPPLAAAVARELPTYDERVWKRDLNARGELLELATQVAKVENVELGREFRTAALSHAQRVRRGGSAYHAPSNFRRYAELLEDGERRVLQDDLYDLASRYSTKATFIKQFGKEISQSTKFRSGDTVRKIWVPLIDGGVLEGLRWIAFSVEHDTSFLSALRKTHVQELRRAIESAKSKATKFTAPQLAAIEKQLPL